MFGDAIDGASEIVVGTPAVLGAGTVLSSRLQQDARPPIRAPLPQIRARIVPFDDAHAWPQQAHFFALAAGVTRQPEFRRLHVIHRGSVAGQPLLCTGDNFGKTDVDCA